MRKILLVLFLLTALFITIPSVNAQPPGEDIPDDVAKRIRSIEEGVKRIEANQKEILDREDKISAELDQIRIWVHRRG